MGLLFRDTENDRNSVEVTGKRWEKVTESPGQWTLA